MGPEKHRTMRIRTVRVLYIILMLLFLNYLVGSMKTPGFKVKLSTHNYFGNVKSSNVIGYVRGAVEPDRYVLLSNHRDAWGYGSVDPSSGTAQLMEVAR